MKLLHLIWIGPKPLPRKDVETWTVDFAQAYPEYTVKVWRDNDIAAFGLRNQHAFDVMPELCGKADIARYEILLREGGIYIDCDTRWLGNPPPEKTSASATLHVCKENRAALMNGFFMVDHPGHPFMDQVVRNIPHHPLSPAWVSVGPKYITEQYKNFNAKHLISFLNIERVLCPSQWHGILSSRKKALEQCQREKSKAFAFHYGLSTNTSYRVLIGVSVSVILLVVCVVTVVLVRRAKRKSQ